MKAKLNFHYSVFREPQEEVEEWVVYAIKAKLIEAKMDQEQEVVMITRATHRHFRRQDWIKLQEKLHLWQHNVQNLLQTLRAKKMPHYHNRSN